MKRRITPFIGKISSVPSNLKKRSQKIVSFLIITYSLFLIWMTRLNWELFQEERVSSLTEEANRVLHW